MKARQYNCQAKKDQRTNNYQRHTTMIIFLYNVIFVDVYSTFDWVSGAQLLVYRHNNFKNLQ